MVSQFQNFFLICKRPLELKYRGTGKKKNFIFVIINKKIINHMGVIKRIGEKFFLKSELLLLESKNLIGFGVINYDLEKKNSYCYLVPKNSLVFQKFGRSLQ